MRYVPACGLSIFLAATLAAQPTLAQEQESWSATFTPGVGAVASVPGDVTWGDRLNVIVDGASCDSASVFFTALSHAAGDRLKALKDKDIDMSVNDKNVTGHISSIRPFVMGHIAMIDLEKGPLATIKAKYAKMPKIDIKLSGQNAAVVAAFEVLHNSWNTKGIGPALDQAQQLCQQRAIQKASKGVDCDEIITLEGWALALKSDKQDKYLGEVKQCLDGDAINQAQADALNLKILDNLDKVSEALATPRATTAAFLKRSLLVAAESGYPSSQHNYATIHNMDSRLPAADLFAEDQEAFILWTRKAAAQKEPRAMFNLAVRLLPVPNSPLPPDTRTAYILLQQIQAEVGPLKARLVFGNHLNKLLNDARTALGPDKVSEAEAARASFDFASLAP